MGCLVDTIQITENELFEIIGRSQVEIYAKDKELTAYRSQFEKLKPALVEAEAMKTKSANLEISNKALAEKNIQLDQALTEARKETNAMRVELSMKAQTQVDAENIIKAQKAELDETKDALEEARRNSAKKPRR